MTKVDGSSSTTMRLRRTSTAAVLGGALIVGGCVSRELIEEVDTGSSQPDAAASGSSAAETSSAPETPDAALPDAGETLDADTPPVDAATEGDAGPGDAGDAAIPADGGDAAVTPDNIELDLFGTFHNTFKFVASEEQRARMNERYSGGGGPIFLMGNEWGDIYTPGGATVGKTYVDHLFVTNPSGDMADFGKIEVKLVGESTGRAWTENTLPNFRVDTDEFTKGLSFGGYKNVRFNNAIVGSILREKFTLDFYRALGYPAPMAGYSWVQSPVWGEQKIPYVVVEVYKRSFCNDREDYFGGECPNMWELVGDFGQGQFLTEEACQFNDCDSTRVMELDDLVASTPPGPGFKDALSEYLDWDAFHQFQCLSWIFVTGDDALHNTNNFVLVERPDGKFQHLPYSVDISFGFNGFGEGYRYVPLPGRSSVSRGCQSDPECWADTVATCDSLLDAFSAADPVARLDALYGQLGEAGMLRSADEAQYNDMRSYIEERLVNMPTELDAIREDPNAGGCPAEQIMCGNYCAYPWDCHLCNEGGGGGGFGKPIPIDLQPVPEGEANDAIIVIPPPDPVPVGDAGAPPPPADGGAEPNPCLPREELYRAQ